MSTPLVESDHGAGQPAPVAFPPQQVTVYGKRVLVVMPWQKQVCPLTAFSVGQIVDRRRTAVLLHYGDAFVAHSRNTQADMFLDSPCEWMLTIDDDMLVPFGDAKWYREQTGFNFPEKFLGFNALDRLLSHGKSLVGALYFGRHAYGPPVYNEGANAQEAQYARSGPHDLIKPCRWVGTGCMLIHRRVFEDIEKKFPRLARNGKKGGQWFTSTEASSMTQLEAMLSKVQSTNMTGETAFELYNGLHNIVNQAKFENPLGVGEDVSFCLRATAAGHQPYVDMGLVCGHIGYTVFGPRNTSNKP